MDYTSAVGIGQKLTLDLPREPLYNGFVERGQARVSTIPYRSCHTFFPAATTHDTRKEVSDMMHSMSVVDLAHHLGTGWDKG
jgi:hypothetical protein